MAAAAPRVAAANALGGQKSPCNCAVFKHRVHRINRARGREPAAASGTEQENLRGRNRQAISADRQNQDVLEQVHVLVY